LDDAQVKAGNVLLSAADWIDSFFDDQRSFSEVNTTRAVVKLSLGYSKNDDFEVKPRFDLRLRLPRLSSRAQFIISYRQRFYRDWLVLEVSPRISFPEDHDRDPNSGIIFKIEAAIGYKADEQGF
jgi:hypothetical protein